MSIQQFRNLKLLAGLNTYPGSGPLEYHDHEIELFEDVLDNVRNRMFPVMIEVGCHWALWSLMFRDRYPDGDNILIELGKRALLVGQANFVLNNFSCNSYFGGLFVSQSGTFTNKAADLEYDQRENDHLVQYIPTINNDQELVGPELDFHEIYKTEGLNRIDVFHMDIQGSEKQLVPFLLEWYSGKIDNIVVATHSVEIHRQVVNDLVCADYKIVENEGFGSVGGDGYVYARLG